jgi:hypothetical protein
MKRVRQFLLAAVAVAALEVALQPRISAQITLKPRVDPGRGGNARP